MPVNSNAHLQGYLNIGGTWVHTFSLGCFGVFGGVPNPTVKPSQVECEAEILSAQILCANPNGKSVVPGVAGLGDIVSASTIVDENDIVDKKKGKAEVFVDVPTDFDSTDCKNNWHLIEDVVLAIEGKIKVFECTGPDGDCSQRIQTYEEVQLCTLPAEFNILNPPPDMTPFDCVQVSAEHIK